ncbi:MAG: glycosyltransferase family 2 protein [Xanthobacteraceae bacterium]|nr:glycosyltransferase family 2 protein [Xanthobacteraceae bacterium]
MSRSIVSTPRAPITVIIPVFGRPDTLRRALRSLRLQSLLPDEVIVVDDGSPDPIDVEADIVAALSPVVVRHETNRGVAAARNTGIRTASNDWITFLDSDDWLLPDSIEQRWNELSLLQALAQPERKEIYGSGWIERRDSGQAIYLNWPNAGVSLADFASGCWMSPGSCIVLNKKIITAPNRFQDVALRRYEDFDWLLSLAREGIRFTPLRSAGIVVERTEYRNIDEAAASRNIIIEKWKPPALSRKLMRRLRAYLAIEIAAVNYRRGELISMVLGIMYSYILVPRLSLHFSPGRRRVHIVAVPEKSLK